MRRRTDRIELTTRWAGFFLVLAATAVLSVVRGQEDVRAELEGQFTRTVRPFLETYCISCHGQQQPAAQMDLSGFTTMAALMQDGRRWSQMLERLEAEEMPPKGARHPTPQERRVAVDWFHAVREHETRRNAGDPGVVLARRLSNAEYNYTIRDLTGVDIRPAREFPVDPANTAGFDNSGETLMMSPTLLKKYLAAAREVASHMYLKEEGFAFAPHPMLVGNRPRQVRRASDHRFLSRSRTSTTPIIFKPPGASGIGRRSGSPTPRWPASRGNTASAPSIWRPSGRPWRVPKRSARW